MRLSLVISLALFGALYLSIPSFTAPAIIGFADVLGSFR